MSEAIIESNGETTSITCARGSLKSKMKLILEDRSGNEYFSTYGKDTFEMFPEIRSVEVYEIEGMGLRKFVKKYLKIKKELEPKIPKKRSSTV